MGRGFTLVEVHHGIKSVITHRGLDGIMGKIPRKIQQGVLSILVHYRGAAIPVKTGENECNPKGAAPSSFSR